MLVILRTVGGLVSDLPPPKAPEFAASPGALISCLGKLAGQHLLSWNFLVLQRSGHSLRQSLEAEQACIFVSRKADTPRRHLLPPLSVLSGILTISFNILSYSHIALNLLKFCLFWRKNLEVGNEPLNYTVLYFILGSEDYQLNFYAQCPLGGGCAQP